MNPIITDKFTADPHAFVENDTVYIFCGQDTLPPDSPENEYFRMPHWLLYTTKDMKTFKEEGIVLKPTDFEWGSPNSAWACDAIKGLDNRYYLYVTVWDKNKSCQSIGVAVADNPAGPYIPIQKPVITYEMTVHDTGYEREDNIDPTVFIDDNTPYLVWGQRSPRMARLKKNMIEIERPIYMAFPPDWKSQDPFEEGAYLYKRNKFYYMVYASMGNGADGSGAETLSYAMAENINGPWTDGIKFTESAPGTGGEGNSFTIHPCVIEFKGQSYLLYHNAALTINVDGKEWKGDTGRRSMAIDYLYYNQDGTIQFIDVRSLHGLSSVK